MTKRKASTEKQEHKKSLAQGDAPHRKNWKEYVASVEDIQNFLMDRVLLRHNVITRRVEYREPERDLFLAPPSCVPSVASEQSSSAAPEGASIDYAF